MAKEKDSVLFLFLHREIRDGYIIPLRERNINGSSLNTSFFVFCTWHASVG